MDEKTKDLYEAMKENKSLAPIAELARLVMVAQNTAKQAEEIGDRLSVFAVKAEASQEKLPPVTAWMKLCDIYKDSARMFATILRKAVEASRIYELEENMKDYADEVVAETARLIAEDDNFRTLFNAAVHAMKRKGNGPKNAE